MKFKVTPILGTILFLFEAVSMIFAGDFLWSLFPVIALAINMYSFRKIKVKPELSNVFLAVINGFFSFIIAWYYLDHQAPYYKIYWIISGFIFLLVAMSFLKSVQHKYLK